MTNPTPAVLSPKIYRDKALLNIAWQSSILIFIVFLLKIGLIQNDVNSMSSYILTEICVVLGMVYLYFKKNARPVIIFYSIAGSLVTQLSCWTIPETNHYTDFMWIAICSFIGFWGGKKHFGFALVFANLIGMYYFIFYHYNHHVDVLPQATSGQLINFFTEMAMCMGILAYLFYKFNSFQEVWEEAYEHSHQKLSEQHETVRKQNDENIILLKEIHHRVKNNLQIIVSLLRLQKDELNSTESKTQFQEAINRVLVMSSIHQKLYQQEDFRNINLTQHLGDLIKELKHLYKNDRQIDIGMACSFNYMDLKTMVPVGLLINELVSNSFKYAFKNRSKGEINIRIYQHENGFNIDYSDNGKWNPTESDAGFGLELIEVFTQQLNGEKTFVTNQEGTRYSFKLEFAD